MKIAIFTNTYLPHVGGVAKSVAGLVNGMKERGHAVLVVAPEFDEQPDNEEDVLRIPSIQNFNGTDFSFKLPSGNRIGEAIKSFHPDIVHSHHPFLLGDAAMRHAHQWGLPLVFTHHTLYEDYVHYVLDDSQYLRRLAMELATEYANLCDRVIAPSESLRKIITLRGVITPVVPIPTGVDTASFRLGNGNRIRRQLGIAPDAFLIGHVGRLASEKNLPYLAEAVCQYLETVADSRFLLAGEGELSGEMTELFDARGLQNRVVRMGKLNGEDLVDTYHAMDLFVFSSKSETQGMVLAEAMAAGVPVVALDASGVRDIVEDGINGTLLPGESTPEGFAAAINRMRTLLESDAASLAVNLQRTAMPFSSTHCLDQVEALYLEVHARKHPAPDPKAWDRFANRVEAEWEIAISRARALGAALYKEG